eukprot:12188959-Prorocentrum_lima.AAC.1
MRDQYRQDINTWPQYGCGATFLPRARGASAVAEVKLKDGTWQAFMADRLPRELDDEIRMSLH